MDFHSMRRKELQKLCKKHSVPANLTNREMADRLASIYKQNEKSVSLEKLSTNPEEIGGESEAKVVKKQAKKVRFSPENQTFEYEVSVYRWPRRRSRKQSLSKNPGQTIENAPNREDIRKFEDCQVRVTRSRVQNAIEDDVNMVFSAPIGRKRRRGGMKNRDAKVNNIGKSEILERGEREDDHDKVTGGLSGRQLRSRKNVTQEGSKIRKGKGGDYVHLSDKIYEETDVFREDVKSKNGRKQPRRNARKEDQSVTLSSEVEEVEVVCRVTRQSRAQPRDIDSMVKSEVKADRVHGRCKEVLQLKEPQKGRGKNALRQNVAPQRVSAESSLIAVGDAAAEKPLRLSKRKAEKDSDKSATSVRSETQVTEVQEQSERDIALEEPPECLRRYSSRRKSVVSHSGKRENKEEFSKKETNKRSRTAKLDAIVEHSGEIEMAKYAFTLQDQAPLRRSGRKTVILNPPAQPDTELAYKEDIDKMQQLRAPSLRKDVTEELPRKSSQSSSTYNLSGTSKGDQIAVAKKDQGVKLQMQEPSLEEEKTSVVEHHLITEKPQRRSNRTTSISASVAPRNPTAKIVKKGQPSKSRTEIVKEEAALTESLPVPGELPAGKDELVVAEGSGNKNDLDLNFSKQAVKNTDRCSKKKRKELRGNSGAKKQSGFAEEILMTTSEKFVGLSTNQEMQQPAHKSMVVVEKESNLFGDDRERLVHGGNVESEVNCVSSQSVTTICVFDDCNCSNPKLLEFESNVSHVVGSSEINFSPESPGYEKSDQEMKEDMKPIDTDSANESLVVYKEDRSLARNDKQRLLQVESTDNEMHLPQSSWSSNGSGAVDDFNLLESRQVELESNVINMVSSKINSLSNSLSLADQRDLTGATSTLPNSEKELETEPPRNENTNFMSDNVNADDSRTPFGEAHILVELKDTNVTAAESFREAIFKDTLNEFGETSGLKSGSENTLKKAEEMIATDFSNREGIPRMESSVKASENKENSAEFHFAPVETGAQKIIEIQLSSYSNTVAPETPCGLSPGNQFKDKTCRVEAADTAVRGLSDQEKIEDLNPGNVHFIHESVLIYGENTGVVKNDGEIRIRYDSSEGEMRYQSCLSLNGTGAVDDSNLVEPRMVDFESNGSRVVSPVITSLANVFSSVNPADFGGALDDALVEPRMVEFESNANKVICSEMTSLAYVCSSASQTNFAGETSNELKPEKVLESEELPRSENVNYKSVEIEVEDDKSPALEDPNSMHLEDANTIAAESVQVAGETSNGLKPEKVLESEESPRSENVNYESDKIDVEDDKSPAREDQNSMHLEDTNTVAGTIYRVETAVSNAGSGMCNHQKNKENVNIVENEHDGTIKTEKELFFCGKKIIDESFEGKFLEDGVCHRFSDSHCAKNKKVNVSDGSFNNVSCETEGNHICEVFDEGTDLVSSEAKDNDIFESASHADVSLQCISNEKLSFNGCLPVSNDMQEKLEAVCMDNKNMRNEIQANFFPRLVLEQLDNENEAAKQGAENGDANAGAISYAATQALPSAELTAPILSEPFSVRPHDHALVDGERNSSGERVMDHPFNKDFAATMDSNEISVHRETNVGQDDYISEDIAISSLKVALADHSDCKVVSNEFTEEISNTSVGTRLPFVKVNYGDLDDLVEEVALQSDCSSSIGLNGLKSTVGIIVDNISKVGISESTLNSNDPQSGTKVDDPDVNDSNAANEFDVSFTVEVAGLKDGGKAPVSHERSLLGGKQEYVPSYADKPCKPEISIGSSTLLVSCEKELHPLVIDHINDVGGTEISIECKVTREVRDGCKINTGGFSDVTDGSLVKRSKGDLEEIAEAKSEHCEGSVKTATFMDSTKSLDESKICDLETDESHGLDLHNEVAGDTKEVGSSNKLDIVSSMKPKMVIGCSSVSSVCANFDEHKDLENPDESQVLIDMEMRLFAGDEDEVSKPDANAGDSTHSALDKTITECNSSNLKEDYVARSDVGGINFSVKKDGPEDIEETMELRKDVLGLVAAMEDKIPLLKNSEVGRVVDREEAIRSELDLPSSKMKKVTTKKEGSNSLSDKQLTSSIMKSKSKSSLIQRTPKRLKIYDLKENKASIKREQIGNRTTPKTSSKRPPLQPVWK